MQKVTLRMKTGTRRKRRQKQQLTQKKQKKLSREPGQESSEASDDGEKKEKKFFGKKKKDKKDEKIEELTDKLTRQMAEFDNFRKRTEKEKSQMYEVGAKDIIEKILPVVDNFERGLAGLPGGKKITFVQGTKKSLQTVNDSARESVKPIEAVGKRVIPISTNADPSWRMKIWEKTLLPRSFKKVICTVTLL